MARRTRQLAIFPLATITVGWVPDRTPEAEASAEDSKRSESCAGGLPTENAAKGKLQYRSMYAATDKVVGIGDTDGRDLGRSLCCEQCADVSSAVARWALVHERLNHEGKTRGFGQGTNGKTRILKN